MGLEAKADPLWGATRVCYKIASVASASIWTGDGGMRMTNGIESARTDGSRRLVVAMVVALAVTGCGTCDETSPASLEITAPTAGASLTSADDVDSATPGFQYDVVVAARGLAEGEVVSLYPDASVVDADPYAIAPYQAVVGSAETVTLRATLAEGSNSLVACARNACSVRSPIVDVTVNASPCPSVVFTSPAPGTGSTLVLGGPDDADGTACGDSFKVDVRADVEAPAGTTVQLVVNGVNSASAPVSSDGKVDFGAVTLGNRNTDANTLEIVVPGAPAACSGAFGKPIFVDCTGPSCAFFEPVDTNGYLNASNDADPAVPGLQVGIEVSADADVAGHPVTIVVDGDMAGARTVNAGAAGAMASAQFPNVPLSEGAHAVQATCTDSAGNKTLSSVAAWTVDTVPCVPTFTVPTDNALVTVANDADASTPGIQLATSGSLNATDCSAARVADCNAIAAATYAPTTGTTFASTVSLATTQTQTLCVDARDAAGNVARDMVSITVDSAGPKLAIVTPSIGTKYNVAGTAGGVADLVPATPACDAAFAVDCSGIGTNVDLLVNGSTTPVATVSCMADTGSLLGGRATFASVALPTTTSSFSVVAQQTVSGNLGASVPIALSGDCEAPTLSVASPSCGSTLTEADDQDATTPGIQHDVTVASSNVPQLDVTLSIAPTGGGGGYVATSPAAAASGTNHIFLQADFDTNGMKSVTATATDAFGNVGTSPSCTVTVTTNLPTVAITAPSNGATINASNAATFDCNGATPALDLLVTATTNATAGSAATVRIGSDPVQNTTVSGGMISLCVPVLQQGTQAIDVTVNDTDASDGAVGMASASPISVSILTTAPSAIAPLTVVYGTHDSRRQGQATITFQPVVDATGDALASYSVRCAFDAIVTQTDWDNATNVPTTVVPTTSGTQSIPLQFRQGLYRHCLVRGTDTAGNVTALPASDASVLVNPGFEYLRVSSASGVFLGFSNPAPVGDVNGDGINDLVQGGQGSAALYFGASTPTSTAPSVLFLGPTGSRVGLFVAGLGDFNSDGRSDFAISDPTSNANDGSVYIFFGRAAANPWPATITVSNSTCVADLCIRGVAGGAQRFGRGLTSAGDFDGDGHPDLAIGNRAANEALVVLGTTTVPASSTWTLGSNDPNGFRIQGAPTVTGGADFGYGVVYFGDTNSDTRADLVISRPGLDASNVPSPSLRSVLFRVLGRAYTGTGLTTISGGTDVVPILDDASWNNGICATGNYLELGVADFDDDGHDDIACTISGPTLTSAYIVYGQNDGTFDPATRTTVTASVGASGDGYALFAGHSNHPVFGLVGDVDKDLIEDALMGSLEIGTHTDLPAALVVYGRSGRPATIDTLTDSAVGITVPQPAPAAGVQPIRRVGYVGDVTGDGWPDVVVGDPITATGDTHGQFFLLY